MESLRFLGRDGALPGRTDEPNLLQDPQGVPDLVLRDTQPLRESDDTDGLVFLHGPQDGNVAAKEIQVPTQSVGQRVPFSRLVPRALGGLNVSRGLDSSPLSSDSNARSPTALTLGIGSLRCYLTRPERLCPGSLPLPSRYLRTTTHARRTAEARRPAIQPAARTSNPEALDVASPGVLAEPPA